MSTRVVGAALIRGDRVLAARRTRPPSIAGRWEFPGGKVETGESDQDALMRELREELSIEVQVLESLGRVPLGDDGELTVHRCQLTGGMPQAGSDHDRVRWLSASELSSVDWLDSDRLLLDTVREALLGEARP